MAMKAVDSASKKSQMSTVKKTTGAEENNNENSNNNIGDDNASSVVSPRTQQEIDLQINLNSEFEVLIRVITFQVRVDKTRH